MPRQDEIKSMLTSVAPLFLEMAESAQAAAAEFESTDWARKYLARTASVNQMAGTGRWRILGDQMVARAPELPKGLELSTTDKEQNQGRYYLRAADLAVVMTIRRKPHAEDDHPTILQTQMQAVIEMAPVKYADEIAIYFSVPPRGKAPSFQIATAGKETLMYRLEDLINDAKDDADVANMPQAPQAGAVVSSTRTTPEVGGSTSSSG